MKIIITIEIDGNEVKVSTEQKEAENETKKIDICEAVSDYARWFDDSCCGWTKDPEYNLTFLKCQERYANDMLRAKGFLFLNEVYDMLGMPKTKAGQVVGWIYNEENPIGDNRVEFGLNLERNADFINGLTNMVLLDFNVDGNILEFI